MAPPDRLRHRPGGDCKALLTFGRWHNIARHVSVGRRKRNSRSPDRDGTAAATQAPKAWGQLVRQLGHVCVV